MEKNEIILENNVKIAAFMGFEFIKGTKNLKKGYWKKGVNPEKIKYISTDPFQKLTSRIYLGPRKYALKFNSYWHWLIAVVSKIEYLGYSSIIKRDNKNKIFSCSFIDINDTEIIFKTSSLSRKEAVYLAVVEFIEWNNKIKNNI